MGVSGLAIGNIDGGSGSSLGFKFEFAWGFWALVVSGSAIGNIDGGSGSSLGFKFEFAWGFGLWSFRVQRLGILTVVQDQV